MRAFKALRGAALPACAAFGVLVPLCGVSAAGAETISQTFSYTGAEQTFTVPAGVFSVQVLAVGGSGGSGQDWYDTHLSVAGGAAAQVSGDLSVRPGETLYVEVGGNGQNRASGGSGFPSGGYNGGGNGGGGGGGGASDVRTSPRASGLFPGNRLLVAAGGGGGGTYGLGSCIGGAGGAAGQPGQGPDAEEGCREDGGGPATQSSGGAPVTNARCPGQEGQFGIGGDGGPSLAFNTATCRGHGGGGGGGYYGGGGGGGGYADAGGGGGGGSCLVPVGGTVELASSEAQPQVQIVARHGHRQHRGG